MLNRVCLMGRLVNDPELRSTPNNIHVTSFAIAVDRSYVKAGSERETDFINIVAWRNVAEFISKWFHKGQLIAIDGSIQTRKYTDRDGNNRTAFEIVADNAYFAGDKQRDGSQSNTQQTPYNPPAPSFQTGDSSDFDEIVEDEDLPF